MKERPSLLEATTVVHQSLDTSKFSEGIQGTSLSNSSCKTSQYCLADVAFFPAGDRQVLTYVRGTEIKRLLQTPVANLLAQCQTFKTIDEHVDTYCREQQLSGAMLETIRSKLQHQLRQLAQEGYLISSNQIHQLFQASNEQISPSPITSIVFPTCNRVEGLQRCITSYIEHCQCFGRNPDFIVSDDSMSPATRDAYREMLCALKAHYGVNIAYAGLEEKMAFAKRLSEEGDIPAEVVSWACIGDKQYGVSTLGANRNALLLHTVGECIFTTDDDAICRVAASPGFKDGLALISRGDRTEYWFYPDRDSALASVKFVEQDILALHEQWLGQDPRAGIASYSRNDLLSFEQATDSFLHRLAMRSSKIAVTAHGVVGDASYQTTEVLIFQSGESLKRLASSEQAYRSAHASHETAQAVNQITIREMAVPLIGMYMGGLDNRKLLPPFTPVGRCEDAAFGLMLTKCFPDVYTVHLPWVLIHAPLEARSYSEPTIDVPFYELVLRYIGLFDPGFTSTPVDRLEKLGRFLDEIGHLPTPSFADSTRQMLWRMRGGEASLREKLLRNSQVPDFWRRDAEAYYERMRQSMLLPIEQLLSDGLDVIQRALVQFAQVLKWWPAMVETARRLRAEGYRLAQPI